MNLIFFDMDGVLIPKLHLLQLAEMTAKANELSEILKKVSAGTNEKGLEKIIKEIANLFAHTSEPLLEEAGKRLPLMKGAVETIKILKKIEYHPILITSGIEQVARVVARRLEITEWYANTLEIKDGKTTGHFHASPLLTLQSKGDLVQKIVTHRSSKKECIAVGNDVNDWLMFCQVGISILFNPSPYLGKHLQWCLDNGEKGFKKEFIEFSKYVNYIIKEPDLRLLLPFLAPVSPHSAEINSEPIDITIK